MKCGETVKSSTVSHTNTSEEDLEPDLVRDMKTLSSLMMTK